MCFDCFGRKQKNNFGDSDQRDNVKATKDGKSSTTPYHSPSTIPPIAPKPNMSPKVAIVIYSLYGHITQRSFVVSRICYPYSYILDIQLQRQRKLGSKAQVERLLSTSKILFRYLSSHRSHCLLATRVAETLPQEVLTKMHAPEKPNYPIITPEILATYDAFLLGIPTRYGNMPAQWKVRLMMFCQSN